MESKRAVLCREGGMKMGKEYGHRYFHAGSGCETGRMVCAVCNKAIDSDTQDWVSSKKTEQHDWKYVTRHRECVSCQKKGHDIEQLKKMHEDRVASMVAYLKKMRRKCSIRCIGRNRN